MIAATNDRIEACLSCDTWAMTGHRDRLAGVGDRDPRSVLESGRVRCPRV